VRVYSQGLLFFDHFDDTVVHVLDKFDLAETETTLVGNVVGTVVGLSVLTVSTADLDVVLVGDSLELGHVLGKLGELDVDGSAESCAEVSGAGGDVTEMVVVSELADGLDMGGGAGETLENGVDIGTLLHGDDTELIFFIDPDEESLGVIVEDTTALGPVTVETAGFEETISFLEKEMVLNELLLGSGGHGSKVVESTLEVTFESFASGGNLLHDFHTLFVGNTRAKGESSKIAANADTGRDDHSGLITFKSGGDQGFGVHVGNVLGIGSVTVIVLDDLVKELVE